MANYKVAYGRKDNMDLAIERGIIPPGCIILTEDSNEMFFYDLTRNLTTYEEKYKFTSLEEAEEWVSQYDCKGQILSIHTEGKCIPHVVEYDNQLSRIGSTDYIVSDKNPTDIDSSFELLTHWINADTDEVFILVSIREDTAIWKSITNVSDSSYDFTQVTESETWVIEHMLDKFPSINVVDSTGDNVIGEITYIDSNTLYIRFTSAISGHAYLN